MRALVLSGGGALGAYEAGAISVVCKSFDFDLVCGTSIGALNASFVAQNRLDDLYKTWSTIGRADVITLEPIAQHIRDFANSIIAFQKSTGIFRQLFSVPALISKFKGIGPIGQIMSLLGGLSPDPIAKVLQDNVDFTKLLKALIISGTNLSTGNSDAFYWFPNSQAATAFKNAHDKGLAHELAAGNIHDAIRASSAIPFAFAPVSINVDGATSLSFVDGGVANNTPLGVAIDAGATDITVIFLNPPDQHTPQSISNLAEVGLTCFSIMQERILELDFKSANYVNDQVKSGTAGVGSTGKARVPINLKYVQPSQTLPISVLQFDRQDLIDKVYAQGSSDAAQAVLKWQTSGSHS